MSATTSRASAWYFLGILAVLYATSFVDRFILALLVEPVSAEFRIDDTIQGLMLGAGFSIVYAIAGPILAHYLDRHQRRRIVAAGAVIWGGTTLASGFANSVEMLVLCRAGVAIGEAVLAPAAISLIADLFPPARRPLAVAIFVGVAPIMSAGGHVVGAGAYELASALTDTLHLAPWRLTLVIVGLPSILIALLMMATTREPARRGNDATPKDSSLSAVKDHVFEHWAFYGSIFLAYGLAALIFYGISAWLPTLIMRGFNYSIAQAGALLGSVGAVAGLTGAFAGPMIAGFLGKRDQVAGQMLLMVGAAFISLAAALVGALQENIYLFMGGFALAILTHAGQPPVMGLIVQSVAPGRMHARLASIPTLSTAIIGFTGGPYLIPLIAKNWPNDPHALGHGIAVLSGVTMLPVVFLYAYGLYLAKKKALGRTDGL